MTSISFPESVDGLTVPAGAMVRGGGTDVQERLRSDNARPDIIDLTRIFGFTNIDQRPDGTTIGAGAKVATVARELADSYPALAETASDLATPQIRNIGTIGGNLIQHTRCWYYRHPDLDCFKSGGDSCPARTGRHLYGVAFDTSDCVHPHPSSLGMALLAYDATVNLSGGDTISVAELLGDGSDPTVENQLPEGQVVATINLPAPWPDEQASYFRAISRHLAEWPLVEMAARLRFNDDGTVAACGLAMGGVAPVPLRMSGAEEVLVGRELTDEVIAQAAQAGTAGANPLPETGYKVELIAGSVIQVLETVRGARAGN